MGASLFEWKSHRKSDQDALTCGATCVVKIFEGELHPKIEQPTVGVPPSSQPGLLCVVLSLRVCPQQKNSVGYPQNPYQTLIQACSLSGQERERASGPNTPWTTAGHMPSTWGGFVALGQGASAPHTQKHLTPM